MLTHLTISNYALIRQLELQPSSRLTVITGETGAGKSIMLGAISLLLGHRADTKVLWDESEKCITEGTFDISDYKLKSLFQQLDLDYSDQTVLRREISPGGKSRAFINDTPVNLDIMRQVGARLMDVHSQHENLELGNHQFQLALIDSFAGNDAQLTAYCKALESFQEAQKKHAELSVEADRLKSEFDFIKFQLDELQKAAFMENEQEELESSLKISEHAEEVKRRLSEVDGTLDKSERSVQAMLREAMSTIQPLRTYSPQFEKFAQRLESLRLELKDLVSELQGEEESIEVDPARTKELHSRLDLLYTLLQKHRKQNISDLLKFQKDLEMQALRTSNLDEDLAKAKMHYDEANLVLQSAGEKLRATRLKTFPLLTTQLVKLLRALAIPDAAIQIDHNAVEPGPRGADQVDILFSANKGIAPKPLETVASGGEFSRLMFCVKYVLAEKTALPTLVLDEIDTGVSGEIAIQLGKMMVEMAQRHQLIAISHLPQIAARGEKHFVVFKSTTANKTATGMKVLNQPERIEEIAKMIGGANPSTVARENAKELIGL